MNIPMPNGLSKAEIVDLLLKEEYGYLPENPDHVKANELLSDEYFCAGKAIFYKRELECSIRGKSFSFPIYYTKRISDTPSPTIIQINFRTNVPDKYQPTEELIDRGYNVMSFCYEEVTKDNDDFTDGLAGIIYPDGRRDEHQCGKIGLWAWAAMRVIDYATTLPEVDCEHILVAGHSRLGKTALVTGMLDERIYCAFANDSGCSGAAISRDKRGERIKDIMDTFPYWFSESYKKYIGNEDNLPFDQHYLIAANIPHRVYITSASEDIWSDPEKEYLACRLAAKYYNRHSFEVSFPEKMPEAGTSLHDGYIGYSIKQGKHYFSRTDWLNFLDYIETQI